MITVNKTKLNYIAGAIAAFAAFALLRLGGGGYFGNALAFGLFVGIIITQKNPLYFATAYFASSLIFGWQYIVSVLMQCVVIATLVLIHQKMNKKIHPAMLAALMAISMLYFFIMGANEPEALMMKAAAVACALLFAGISALSLKAVINKGLRYGFGIDETVCIAALTAALFMGISSLSLGIPVGYAFAAFTVLLIINVFGGSAGFVFAVSMGLGCALSEMSLAPLAMFTLWAAAAFAFMSINRFFGALALITAHVATVFVFGSNTGDWMSIICVAFGAGLFAIMPMRYINRWQGRYSRKEKYSSRHIVNRLRSNLSQELYQLSDIFFAMEKTFKSMVQGVMPVEKARIVIAKEVCDQVCTSCPEKHKCWRMHISETENCFLGLTDAALERGKVSIIDVGNILSTRCGRVNALLAAVNQQVVVYKQYYTMRVGSDNARLLIGEQLGGVSAILKNLSEQSRTGVSFDTQKEKELIEELNYNKILATEAVIYNDGQNNVVAVVMDTVDARKKNLSEIMTKAMKTPLMVDKTESTENSELTVVHFKPKPKFDVTFGFSTAKKEGSDMSGDTHSFLKIANDKFLLALCDGMGSGQSAEETSSRAISLVENFYKAGFDNQVILSSVNRLLASGNDEYFSALDICVIDLKNGLSDFIKIGAPSGVVKCGGKVEYIEGGSLPMGILEEMRPVITKKVLTQNDFIVMYSDGVEEAMGNRESVAEIVNTSELKEPQALADMIMDFARSRGTNKDDMTVIVSKIV